MVRMACTGRTGLVLAAVVGVMLWAACPALGATASAESNTFGLPSGCSGGGQAVVLVRGLGFSSAGNSAYWSALESSLGNRFDLWRCDSIVPTASLENNARALKDHIDAKVAQAGGSGPASISIVCHSMGGLIARQYLASYGSTANGRKVDKVVFLSTPNCGSHLADLAQAALRLGSWDNATRLVVNTLWPAPSQLTEKFVISNFNPRANSKRSARWYFLGGSGGAFGMYLVPDQLLRAWPPGVNSNLSDGAVTLRSAHGRYLSAGFPHYNDNKQVFASTSPGGREYVYDLGLDHTTIRTADTAISMVRSILQGSPPEPWGVSYGSALALADVEDPWQSVGGASGTVQNADLYTHTFPVDQTSEAAFSCYTPNVDATLTLTTPGGGQITASTVDPSVTFTEQWDENGRMKTLGIRSPAAGQWTVQVFGNAVEPVGEPYTVDVRVRSPLALTEDTPYVQSSAAPVVIKAALKDAESGVAGQAVEASLARELSEPVAVTLYDDGAHSDGAAADGVYANTLTGVVPGFYVSTFRATGSRGGAAFQRQTGTDLQVSAPSAYLAGTFSDSAVDADASIPGVDTLRVQASLNVSSGNKFTLTGRLVKDGQTVASATASRTDLVAGANTVNLDFSGAEVRATGIAGPYVLQDLQVFDDSTEPPLIVEAGPGGYATQAYSPTAFADGTPPEAVTDLRIASVGSRQVTLAWSAPRDDTDVVSYSVRRFDCEPGSVAWESGTPVTGAPAPGAPGTAQQMQAGGLQDGLGYYFALRAADAAGNLASLSNAPYIRLQPTLNVQTAAEGATVGMTGVVTDVRAVSPGRICLQGPGSWGLSADVAAGDEYAVGDAVYAGGVLSSVDGMLRLTGASVTKMGSQAPPTAYIRNVYVGGSALGPLLPGVTQGKGVNNSGLLVRVTGRVLEVATDGSWFSISDGSRALLPGGGYGLRVWSQGLTPPAAGKYVTVTGISACLRVGDVLYPLVYPRSQGDVVVVE